MKKIFVIICFVIVLHNQVAATSAYPYPIKFKQPDGSFLTITLKGDEFLHWALSEDNYTLLQNTQGYLEYGRLDEQNNLVPSGIIAHSANERNASESRFLSEISKNLAFSNSQLNIVATLRNSVKHEYNSGLLNKDNSKVTKNVLFILMNYTDVTLTKTKTDFENLLNQTNYGGTGSFKDYFYEVSYNSLTFNAAVAGPFTTNNAMAYYGGNDGNGYDLRPEELASEAILKADPTTDYTIYDNDADGYVDAVYIIYAGYGEDAGGGANCIWAKAYPLTTPIVCDGKTITKYACSAELRSNTGTDITNIGIICHEFGHTLGAYDFYDTNGATDGYYAGTGMWDLMAGGNWNNEGKTPAHPNPYIKINNYGWSTATTLSTSQSVNITNSAQNNNQFYIINTATADEYFILENRQNVGFNAALPGHGLIIYHKKSSLTSPYNQTSTQGFYPVVANLFTANGVAEGFSYINTDACPYPGTTFKTSFTDYTTPNSKSWANANTDKSITNIVESSGIISFDFMAAYPIDFKGQASSQTQIDLTWTLNNGKDVLVAWSSDGVFGTPTNASNYIAGNSISGGGTVLYVGNATSFSHTLLTAGTKYFYKIWSILDGVPNYSTGTLPIDITTQMTQPGNALSFNGTNNYIEIKPNNATLFAAGSSFTVELWVKSSTSWGSNWPVIAGNENWNNSFNTGWVISGKGNNNYWTFNASDGTNKVAVDGGIIMNDDRWHHIAVTFNRSGLPSTYLVSTYQDGQLINSASATAVVGKLDSDNPVCIGTDGIKNNSYFFQASIDEFRIWNTARDLTAIQTTMNTTLVGNESNLVAYYRFDNLNGTILQDLTANKYDGIIRNSPSWVESYAMVCPTATSSNPILNLSFTANWTAPTTGTTPTKYYLDVATNNTFTTFVSGYENKDVSNVTSYEVTGLAIATNYYYRVRAYNANGQGGNSNVISVVTLNATIWNGTTWDAGTPSSTVNGILSADFTVDADLTTKDLTVNAGKSLTVNSGKTLTVNGTLLLKSPSAPSVEPLASFINNGTTNTTNFVMERNVPANQYNYVSIPVNNTNISQFGNISGGSGSGIRMFEFNGTAWIPLTNSTTLELGRGYAYKSFTVSHLIQYTGAPNSGTQIYNLPYSGYNLIGNPFPSSIDWNSSSITLTNISNTIWINMSDVASGSNWVTYQKGGTATNWLYMKGTLGVIPPTQSFWVQATNTSASVSIGELARTHSSNVVQKTQSNETPLLRLKVDCNGYSDETVLCFLSSATAGYDEFDAKKRMGSGVYPQLYTQTDNIDLAINVLPFIENGQSLSLPLGFYTDLGGTFTINMTELLNFDDNLGIYLEDNTLSQMINLRETPEYTFDAVASTNTLNRFVIHFGFGNPIGVNTPANESVKIYSSGEKIYVSSNYANYKVEIYDINGKKVISQNVKSSIATFTCYTQGVYLVRVISNVKVETRRVFIQR